MNEIPRVDSQVRAELAREAKELLENRAFIVAKATLHKQWYGELMIAATSEKREELIANLRVLEAIPQMLSNLMVASRVAQQRGTDVR